MIDHRAVNRVKAAMVEQRKAFEGDDETMVWHMIADIIEWCDAQTPRPNFDEMVEDVRAHFASEANTPPAA